MLVKNIDLQHLKKLLDTVPEDMDCKSIDLSNGYNLVLTVGDDEVREAERKAILDELAHLVTNYDKNYTQKKE